MTPALRVRMIHISGETRQSYIFPASLPSAFEYFSDVARILRLLPHITVTQQYSPTRFRMLYSTLELGVYRVNIYCDLESLPDPENRRLVFRPLQNGAAPVESRAGLYALTAQGAYSSISQFSPQDDGTRIDFSLKLEARLPSPLALRLAPEWMLDGIAAPIVERRIREIAGGFLQRAGDDYAG